LAKINQGLQAQLLEIQKKLGGVVENVYWERFIISSLR
jgi:hypothetical protein